MADTVEIVERIIVIIAVAAIGFLIYKVYTGQFTAQFASAIGSLGLVAATLISLLATRTIVREQRLERKQDVRPFLKIGMIPVTLSGHGIIVNNIGNGPAKNIEVAIQAIPKTDSDVEDRVEARFELPIIAAGDSIPLSRGTILDSDVEIGEVDNTDDIDDGEILYRPDLISDDALKNFSKLQLTGTCNDMLGNEIKVNSTFKPVFTEEGLAVHMGKRETADELSDIESELSDIRRAIETIVRDRF